MKSPSITAALALLLAAGALGASIDATLQQLLKSGAYDAARLHLEEQSVARANDPALLNDLAAVHTMLGDWRAAEQLLREAMAGDPVMAVVDGNLRKLYAWRASVAYQNALEQPGDSAPAPVLALLTVPNDPGAELAGEPTTALLPHEAVSAALESWRDAWASKQLPAYFAAYEPDYSPYPQLSHAGWRKLRQQRILDTGAIEIELDNVTTSIYPGIAVVTFTQAYHSTTVQDRVEKTLIFTHQPSGGWKITRELIAP